MPAEAREPRIKPATARVFFALWPPVEVADRLGEIARAAARRFGGRATRPETIHLTLAFLDAVPEERLPALCATAAGVRAAPFALSIDRLGFWRHNHLLWAGCQAAPMLLDQLLEALRAALSEAGFNADGEGRHFSPHVTLVRKVPLAAPSAAPELPPISPLAWECGQFVLVRSTLSAAGSAYRVIGEFPLGDSCRESI